MKSELFNMSKEPIRVSRMHKQFCEKQSDPKDWILNNNYIGHALYVRSEVH
jgi:hypothetical protein